MLERFFGRKKSETETKPETEAKPESEVTRESDVPADADVKPEAAEVVTPTEPVSIEPVSPVEPAAPGPSPEPEAKKGGWLARLKAGLTRSSSQISQGISGIFRKRKLDRATLDELEELLIRADLGPATAAKLTTELARDRFDKEIPEDEIKGALADSVTAILDPLARPLVIDRTKKPHVVLVVGVNGSGKTTTIGKLAAHYRREGLSVMVAAGDTFRAAAVEQLKVWSERSGATFFAKGTSDAAGLAFDALKAAQESGTDLVLIDTAGRLHNKEHLMAELDKIVRVIKKIDPSAPHDAVLVLDATTGQNALAQVEIFRSRISGLIVTKLDGTARGGVLVALAEKFGLPVHAIGVGEGIDDLDAFTARDFARSLMGL
jgi:fused signal recognition particle receptor